MAQTVTISEKAEVTKPVEVVGFLAFIALVGTMLFVENVWCRLPLLCTLTILVLIFGIADLFGKGVRLRWRLANAVMLGFVLWHLPAKVLLVILVLAVLLRLLFNRPTPLC